MLKNNIISKKALLYPLLMLAAMWLGFFLFLFTDAGLFSELFRGDHSVVAGRLIGNYNVTSFTRKHGAYCGKFYPDRGAYVFAVSVLSFGCQ